MCICFCFCAVVVAYCSYSCSCSCSCSSIYLFACLSICLSASLKTKLFCETSSIFELDNIRSAALLLETSSIFELDNIKNEASPRDVFNFSSWQHQKRSNSARLPSKMGKLSAELTASYQDVVRFFHCMCLKCCACHENDARKCCTCHAKSS